MTDLVTRITAALDAEEALARAAKGDGDGVWTQPDADRAPGRIEDSEGYVIVYDEGSPGWADAALIVANDPASVLRRIAAQRKVLARHAPVEKIIYGHQPVLVCDYCADLCHSRSGLGCADPDAPWPCPDVVSLAEMLGVVIL